MRKQIQSLPPVAQRIVLWGSVAASMTAIAIMWAQFDLPAPMMGDRAEFLAMAAEPVEEVKQDLTDLEKKFYCEMDDTYRKEIRDTKRDYIDVQQQVAQVEEAPPEFLIEQQLILEEVIEETIDKRQRLKEKGLDCNG